MNTDMSFMVECTTKELVELVMDDTGQPLSEALATVYGSETYAKLCEPRTGLYYEAPAYVYELLHDELTTGRFCPAGA